MTSLANIILCLIFSYQAICTVYSLFLSLDSKSPTSETLDVEDPEKQFIKKLIISVFNIIPVIGIFRDRLYERLKME